MSEEPIVISYDKLELAPRDEAVILVLRQNGRTWATPSAFIRNGERWFSERTGLVLSSGVEILGWRRRS